ncbi:MAG: M50 family metallopeptidase [Candidatus Gribaldobacteria bacterium]|nr:M50 family metallopeptidase [Candidatus Gribaldobacteria bacterium]
MILTIIIIVLTLVVLMALHELGHFAFAKWFKIPVEEFGIGYPPKIIGKKIGETFYSINWLPFGAFVKILGEDNDTDNPNSFAKQKMWKRALVLFGGVFSFWVIAVILFSLILGVWGLPAQVEDSQDNPQARVLISLVEPKSPAELAGLMPYDAILAVKDIQNVTQEINKAQQVIDFTKQHQGQKITLTIARNGQNQEIVVTPRVITAENQGAIGIGLVRAVMMKSAWYRAPYDGLLLTVQQTRMIAVTTVGAIASLIKGEKVLGLKLSGPIGVGSIMAQALGSGIGVYLTYVIAITIWMALFNLLPIPALDGGRLLFLLIEAIRRKPMTAKVEQTITGIFFLLLIGLMAIVTIKDVVGLFIK